MLENDEWSFHLNQATRVLVNVNEKDVKIKHKMDRIYKYSSHLGGFDFVARAAGPPGQVRQDLALLSVHARLHLAPPFLGYDGSWGQQHNKNHQLR